MPYYMGRSPRLIVLCAVVSATALLCVPTGATSAVAEPGPCEGMTVVETTAGVLCTHGGDHVGGGLWNHGSDLAAVGPVRSLAGVPAAPCPGNGTGGRRIVVFYGYPSDTPNNVVTYRTQIRDALAMADANLDAASPGVDGQHYRFLCENDRRVTVKAIALLPIEDDGAYYFGEVIESLANRVGHGLGEENFDKPRYVYSVFVDNIAGVYPYGGQGSLADDDDPDPAANWNNILFPGWTRYSMVRLGWSTLAEAGLWQHEIGHNLGAVQDSAPHSSGAAHCFEDHDVMCYVDGGPYYAGGGSTLGTCPGWMPDGQEPWDCGNDDYYSVDPAPGSYLRSHWNVADSGWLTWST